jgi:hypothetical protein
MKQPWEPKIEDHFDGQLNLEDRMIEQCLDCGGENVVEEMREGEFLYGDGIHTKQVTLRVTHPVFVCQDCGLCTYDSRGEEARDKAVEEYLKQFQSDNVSHHSFPWGMILWISLGVLCVIMLVGLWMYGYYHPAQ